MEPGRSGAVKPHEETWTEEEYEVTVVGPRLERHEDIPRELLARAAPEMARALQHADDALAAKGYAANSMAREVIRAALTKAVVIP